MIERFRSPQGDISPPAGGDLLCPWRQSRQNATGDSSGWALACPYSHSLSPLAFGHLPLTRGVGPRSPITGDAYLLDFAEFPARKI